MSFALTASSTLLLLFALLSQVIDVNMIALPLLYLKLFDTILPNYHDIIAAFK